MIQLDSNAIARFWAKVNKNGPVIREELGPCWAWTGVKDRGGYGRFYLGTRPNRVNQSSHRVSWTISKGDTCGLFVLHKCDNRCCVNPYHLFLGTQTDNMRDMIAKKRRVPPRGEGVGQGKMTEKTVSELKQILAQKNRPTYLQLAVRFGVCRNNIRSIAYGKTWRHISSPSLRTDIHVAESSYHPAKELG